MVSFFKQKGQREKPDKQETDVKGQSKSKIPQYIDSYIKANVDIVKEKTGNSPDIIFRTLKTSQNPEIKVIILYVQGLIDSQSVTDFLIESIMKNPQLKEKLLPHEVLEVISEDVVSLGGVETITEWEKLFLSLLSGDSIIFVDGIIMALVASQKGGKGVPFRNLAQIQWSADQEKHLRNRMR